MPDRLDDKWADALLVLCIVSFAAGTIGLIGAIIADTQSLYTASNWAMTACGITGVGSLVVRYV